jgi:ParB family transcriptional regulator, chromosome partitioning protein
MPAAPLHELDPADCRPRAGRAPPREYEYRNVVHSLRRHGQIVPAIVRPMAPGASHKYEIVAGLRRHRAITHLRGLGWGLGVQLPFLAEIRPLTDAQSFQLAEADNARQNACPDYYRACNYAQALHAHYGDSQTNMAEHLSISAPVLSRYLTLAALPSAIFRAFGEPAHVSVTHAADLSPLLKQPIDSARILHEAADVAEAQETRRQRRQHYFRPSTVHARLMRAAGVATVRTACPPVHSAFHASDALVACGRHANGLVAIELFIPSNHTKSLAAITEIFGAILAIATS